MENERGYLHYIPAVVFDDDSLPANCKLLFSLLSALTKAEGYCWANNKYLADKMKVDRDTVSGWIGQLSKKNYIVLEFDDEKTKAGRKIFMNDQEVVREILRSKNSTPPLRQNTEPPTIKHRTDITTTYIDTLDQQPIPDTQNAALPVVIADVEKHREIAKEAQSLKAQTAIEKVFSARSALLSGRQQMEINMKGTGLPVEAYPVYVNGFFDERLAEIEIDGFDYSANLKSWFNNWFRKQVEIGPKSKYHPTHQPKPKEGTPATPADDYAEQLRKQAVAEHLARLNGYSNLQTQ